MSISTEDWDPISQRGDKEETPSPQCSYRIKRDLMSLCNDPPYGLFVVPDDADITIVHALITGAFDTPYEGGFFYFILRCPPDYPLRPPKVRFMSTGGGEVRFNPNLYKNGKVCLSILGTWSGPCWSPAQSICSVLISIQSILNEKPYHNEPGYEVEKLPGDVEKYNEIIQHETIRVAVCGMIENDFGLTIPPMLINIMQKTFLEYYEYYEGVAQKNISMTGHAMQDPFSEKRGWFQYKTILNRLEAIRAKLLSDPKTSISTTGSPTSEASSPSDTDLDEDSSNGSNIGKPEPNDPIDKAEKSDKENELVDNTSGSSTPSKSETNQDVSSKSKETEKEFQLDCKNEVENKEDVKESD
ncbi:ubiquitin-conjugating enzyme E2 Z-like [Frankliniella occidentalis]|uniref:Ubiquitin-conjugating enzyme E2 Z n=1 Tax=Frankliniella occidentalis TaxID=133901 RepID=A0A6J1SUJ1_FRAOC|nr:ubiquitin-conjugating enzyme E2 Z-like [Frankliniella occidentalis]